MTISPIEIKENIDKYYIVDIREPYEYDYGNIGSINIPMSEFCNNIEQLPTDKTIILMCKSGGRASALCNLLQVDLDYKNVAIMEGGISAWQELVDQTITIE